MSDWGEFYERTKGKPPQPLLVRAVPYVREKVAALDLGSGALMDSAFLLSAGFKTVTAVDHEPIARKRADELPVDRFRYVISKFEHFNFQEQQFDLVNAQYSLPFIGRSEFGTIWSRIHAYLKPKGIFTGQLFGDRDSWSRNTQMTFHTRSQAETLLSVFEVLELQEEEEDGMPAVGPMKHWHVFHFIVRNWLIASL